MLHSLIFHIFCSRAIEKQQKETSHCSRITRFFFFCRIYWILRLFILQLSKTHISDKKPAAAAAAAAAATPAVPKPPTTVTHFHLTIRNIHWFLILFISLPFFFKNFIRFAQEARKFSFHLKIVSSAHSCIFFLKKNNAV